MADFFQNLNFSSANEDGQTELTALAGAKRILCLTGSGTRPLDMLFSDAEEVIAIDLNPAQNALLSLKVAAIERLSHADYLAFLGIAPSDTRLAVYDSLRDSLAPDVKGYWDSHRRILNSGVWYAGKWERLLRWNARFLRLFRGRAVGALMTAPTVADQAAVWQDRFTDSKIRRSIEMIGRDWIWRWVIREPAGEFLPPPAQVADRLASDFAHAAQTYLFRDSDFATLVFRGALDPGGAMPVHLRPEHYQRLRDSLPKLRIVQGGLTELDQLSLGVVDGFSLSDFGSYTGAEVYAACWRGILSVAGPGAGFCERIFMNDLDLPFREIRADADLSAKLTLTDNSIIYRIRAGQIDRVN